MPQLKIQTSVATQNLQLAVVQQAETDARRLAASFIMPLPLPNMNKILAAYVAPIHQMQETLRSLPFIAMNNMIAETMRSQTNILSIITNAHNASFANIAKAASIGIFPSHIIDAEIVDKSQKVDSPKLQNAVIPYLPSASVITIPEHPSPTRSKHGLMVVARNSVMYKRKTLKGISARNVEGRFLIYLLSQPNLFVSDQQIREQFHISNSRSFSWILRNLRNKFKNNGLKLIIERRWYPDGYILIDLYYLH